MQEDSSNPNIGFIVNNYAHLTSSEQEQITDEEMLAIAISISLSESMIDWTISFSFIYLTLTIFCL